ncbi:MAG TPA: hypothetical protein VMU06_08595 [Stellaceae bacterium]|nr:hypothetical protein [Stellaceae bacterium]
MSSDRSGAVRFVFCAVLLAMLDACAVGHALAPQQGTDISGIAPGVPRDEVEAQIGAPLKEWTTSAGAHYCIYARLGDAAPDAGLAATWVAADVMTMGITEMVGAIVGHGFYERRHQQLMAVSYDRDGRVIGLFAHATEFDSLPADGHPSASAME